MHTVAAWLAWHRVGKEQYTHTANTAHTGGYLDSSGGFTMNYAKAERISAEMNERNDCTVKAIAIACDKPYRMVHAMLKAEGRRNRCGCYRPAQFAVVEKLGYKLTEVAGDAPFRFGGTVSTLTKRLPSKGNYVAYVRGHIIAVKNGKVEDWTEGRRHRIQEVYKVERKERKPRHKSNKAA